MHDSFPPALKFDYANEEDWSSVRVQSKAVLMERAVHDTSYSDDDYQCWSKFVFCVAVRSIIFPPEFRGDSYSFQCSYAGE